MPGNPRRLSASDRDRTITIEAVTDSVGASQFPIETWAPLVTVQAAYEEDGGEESFAASQTYASGSVRWTIPYLSTCDPELVNVAKTRRIVAGGRIYDIYAAEPIGRRQGIMFRARALVG